MRVLTVASEDVLLKYVKAVHEQASFGKSRLISHLVKKLKRSLKTCSHFTQQVKIVKTSCQRNLHVRNQPNSNEVYRALFPRGAVYCFVLGGPKFRV